MMLGIQNLRAREANLPMEFAVGVQQQGLVAVERTSAA
jgi:hypothetical protein